MKSEEIRKCFLAFFEKRGHTILPSASLVPENDPSALFTTAGVQPLVPYILQGSHPQGKRLASIQKCVRTTDIEEIGDNTHLTFFEMLGNWSLGDYFKEDAIKWSFELLTDKEEGFGLDINRLYVTVFEGDENAPKDMESVEIWKKTGIQEERIYFRGKDNWWSPGDNGPCGPSTEMFYDLTKEGLGNLTPEEFEKADSEQKVVEIWNDVFMEYQKKDGKVIGKLPQKNVDTGAGFERLVTVLQNKKSIYETDLFTGVLKEIKEKAKSYNERKARIIADHIRTSLFLAAEDITPSKKDRGYVLRKLIRRAGTHAQLMGLTIADLNKLSLIYGEQYKKFYPETFEVGPENPIIQELRTFNKKLVEGLKRFNEMMEFHYDGEYAGKILSGITVFDLYQTYGFPIELIIEIAKEKGAEVDLENFNKRMKAHQELSRTSSAGKFKGGLADSSEETVKLHTAHHLLLASLQKVLGKEVKQRGSNITSERLRIDFSFDRKMTPEEIKQVEDLVNKKIEEKLPVVKKEMSKEEAEKIGAEMEFGVKYGDRVNVYFVEEKDGSHFSKEFCGGPHVGNTGELAGVGDPEEYSTRGKGNTGEIGHFKILKEEASSAGVRRIKATLNS